MKISPLAGKPAPAKLLIKVPDLITAYYTMLPDADNPDQRVAFGTSGHRGSSWRGSFNESHILAITQAICEYRAESHITGPLFIGMDTHALSAPAHATALEVLAANGVEVMIAPRGEYTPTPAVSHAILVYNRGRTMGLADGIVITPSHNPPADGGFKYDPPHGGPAEGEITRRIETLANGHIAAGLGDVKRLRLAQALSAATTHTHDYLGTYVDDLSSVLDMEVIQRSGISMGVDPLGGAGLAYWPRIAERYGLNLTVVNNDIDPTFRFMTVDWDGQIRMDPSSSYAMRSLISLKDKFDIAFACDPDHDRHGIVTRSAGLMPPNHYLCVAISYLIEHRTLWAAEAAIGKTVVSSALIDRVTVGLGRMLYETPVGFKWFVAGLHDGDLAFGGEESAGASFLRKDGSVWTTDKDGIIAALLSAEITASEGREPAECYRELTHRHGDPVYDRVEAPASNSQKEALAKLSAAQVKQTVLAGEPIQAVLTKAPGDGAAIGGLKVVTANGWFAARPSGTEAIYKIYAESFRDAGHLKAIVDEAQALVSESISATG